MKKFRSMNREDSLHLRLSFFLLLGAVLGTVFCNGMDGTMKAELGSLRNSLVSAAVLREVDFGELFAAVAIRRGFQLAIVFLVFMTTLSSALMSLLAGYFGFSCAVTVSALTMDAGLLGIVRYLLLVFPQCLCYLPVFYLLFIWMPLKQASLKASSALALSGLVLVGAAAESLVNPWILAVFL